MNKQLLLSFILPLIIAAAAQDVSAQVPDPVPSPTQQADGTWKFTIPNYDVAIEAELKILQSTR